MLVELLGAAVATVITEMLTELGAHPALQNPPGPVRRTCPSPAWAISSSIASSLSSSRLNRADTPLLTAGLGEDDRVTVG